MMKKMERRYEWWNEEKNEEMKDGFKKYMNVWRNEWWNEEMNDGMKK